MDFVEDAETGGRARALRNLAEIAHEHPDLFTQVCRSWLGETRPPATSPPVEEPPGNVEARGSAGEAKSDPPPKPPATTATVSEKKTRGPRGPYQKTKTPKNVLALQALIEQNGPMRPTAAARALGKNPNEMTRLLKRDSRFYKEDGLIKVRPSPTSPATSGSTA
jgi:hypothetical protein